MSVEDDDLVFGWRYWGKVLCLGDGPPGLSSPFKDRLNLTDESSVWMAPRKTGRPPHLGDAVAGLFAYRTLEESQYAFETAAAISPVVGHNVWWSITDPLGIAWRAESIEVRGLMVSDLIARESQRVADAFGVPLWSSDSIRGVGYPRFVSIKKAVAFAEQLELPNVRHDAALGKQPTGPKDLSAFGYEWPPPPGAWLCRPGVNL